MNQIRHPKFPNSSNDPFLGTSPIDRRYNCIAWAFGDNSRWYWPRPELYCYWPEDITCQETLDAFIELFQSIGYQVCNNGNMEKGVEKVAIYTDNAGKPTHAARQLEDGKWTSKLGESEDVSHSLNAMRNGFYGNVKVFMFRPRQN